MQKKQTRGGKGRHRRARKSEGKAWRRGIEGETGLSEVNLLSFIWLGISPHFLGLKAPLQQLLSKIPSREHSSFSFLTVPKCSMHLLIFPGTGGHVLRGGNT